VSHTREGSKGRRAVWVLVFLCALTLLVLLVVLLSPAFRPVYFMGGKFEASVSAGLDVPHTAPWGLHPRDFKRPDPEGYHYGSGWSFTLGGWRYTWARYEHDRNSIGFW